MRFVRGALVGALVGTMLGAMNSESLTYAMRKGKRKLTKMVKKYGM